MRHQRHNRKGSRILIFLRLLLFITHKWKETDNLGEPSDLDIPLLDERMQNAVGYHDQSPQAAEDQKKSDKKQTEGLVCHSVLQTLYNSARAISFVIRCRKLFRRFGTFCQIFQFLYFSA